MLEECGAQYRTEVVAYGEQMKSAAFRSINPMGKVPVITWQGRAVTEVAAIICFLAELFPEAELAPPPEQRDAYYRWMFFVAGTLEAAVTNKALGVSVADDKRAFVGYGSLEEVTETLTQALAASTWIAGDKFSAADVYAGSHLDYGLRFGLLPQQQVLLDYRDRVSARGAWQRAEALDNALLAPAG